MFVDQEKIKTWTLVSKKFPVKELITHNMCIYYTKKVNFVACTCSTVEVSLIITLVREWAGFNKPCNLNWLWEQKEFSYPLTIGRIMVLIYFHQQTTVTVVVVSIFFSLISFHWWLINASLSLFAFKEKSLQVKLTGVFWSCENLFVLFVPWYHNDALILTLLLFNFEWKMSQFQLSLHPRI